MISTLIIILFLLNCVTIFAVILIYMRQNRLMELEKQQRKNYLESQELLSSFLFELKEENERFAKLLNEQEKTGEKVIPKKVKQNHSNIDKQKVKHVDFVEDIHSTKEVLSDLLQYDQAKEQEPSLIDQVSQLVKEGYSVEQIAKQLNKGKTEIELLIKFQV